VLILLNYLADVNAQCGSYGNALQGASAQGHREILQILLDHGASVNMQGGYYSNALEAASTNEHKEIVNMLLAEGAGVQSSDRRNVRVLHDYQMQLMLLDRQNKRHLKRKLTQQGTI
jgi:ankyrin repeat protein